LACINSTKLKAFPVPLPPLPEQRAIAHVLRTVQRAKEATEKVIGAAKALRQTLVRHLFRYGPVAADLADNIELQDTKVGTIPAQWQVSRLDEVAAIERGKFAHRPRNDPRFYGGAIPFIQTGDVTKSDGRVSEYSQTLNDLGLSVSRVFPKGTIVLTIAANIGDCGILEFDSAFPDSLVGITPQHSLSNEYLNVYLRTQKHEMDRLAPRGTQKNINIRFLEPWPVVVPPSEGQNRIVAIIATINRKLKAEESHRAALSGLFDSMLHNVMTGKVRVQDLQFAEAVGSA